MTGTLDRIEAVARAADDDGRPWEWQGGYPQRVLRVGDVKVVADCFESPDAPSRFAEFIATCDPPTVLALVEVAKAAQEYLEHTEDRDFRRGHTNTACPPLTRAMCKQYTRLRAALARLEDNQ